MKHGLKAAITVPMAALLLTACGSGHDKSAPDVSATSSSTHSSTSSPSPSSSSKTSTPTADETITGTKETSVVGQPGKSSSNLPTLGTESPSSSSSSASHSGVTKRGSSVSGSPSESGAAPSTSRQSSGNYTRKATPYANQAIPNGAPWKISIPSIGINYRVRTIPVTTRSIDPPPRTINWYAGSAAPGSPGVTVVLGHVSSGLYANADILYNIPLMPVGSTFTLNDAKGKTITYKVTSKASINKHSMQTDGRIWSKSGPSRIALVSCDSNSPWVGHHHTNNYVVFASVV